MTDIVSQNTKFEEIHPITKKVLNKEIPLDSLSLEAFREGRILYPSMKEARKKGYFAHHPYPLDIQKRQYEKEHNISFGKGNSGRIKFQEAFPNYDDRCYRMTAFEHILDHYLMARDFGGDYIYNFYSMTKYALGQCTSLEKITLSSLEDWAFLEEEARVIQSVSYKERYKNLTEEEKEAFSRKCKESFTPERLQRMSEITKNWYSSMSIAEKQDFQNKRIETLRKPEVRSKISQSYKEYYRNLSEEEKKQQINKRKEALNSPEVKKKCSASQKRRFLNETEEEKRLRIERHRQGALENVQNIKQGVRKFLDSTDEAYWEKRSLTMKKAMASKEVRKHLSEGIKRGQNTPEALERRAKKSRLYLEMKDKFSCWNEFSSWYSKNKDNL